MAVQPIDLPRDFDLLALHEKFPERYPFLLESVTAGGVDPHPSKAQDILFAFPGETLRLNADFSLQQGSDQVRGEFLPALDAWWKSCRVPCDPSVSLPFQGGWFLFLGYELAGQIEPTLRLASPPPGPVAFATRIPVALIRNRGTGEACIVSEVTHPEAASRLRQDLVACQRQAPMERPRGDW